MVVTVEYKTQRNYCGCCNQKLPNPKTSEVRKFTFTKDKCLDWLSQEDWKIESEYEDELKEIIQEFVYETISFFATSSDTKVLIENSEFEKVKKLILEEVIS